MTQADSVHSTPPTNTSLSRRTVLGAIAVLPVGLPAVSALANPPDRFHKVIGPDGRLWFAADEPDAIFGIIDCHRTANEAHREAVGIEFAFEERHMRGEKLRQYQVLQEHTQDAWDRLEDAGIDLVCTPPTTLAGIAALCRYLEPYLADPDTVALPDTITWEDDTESTPAGVLANSIAVAIREISRVQS